MSEGIFSTFPILNTAKLTLRQLALKDEEEIFLLRSDSVINKYLNRQTSKTIDDARQFINNIIKGNALYWAITLSHKDKLIGTICLYGFSNVHDKCEIGYELLPSFQRQGIMQEALEKVIDYAFHVIRIKKIEAFLHKDNQKSIKLLENLSFKYSNDTDKSNPDLLCYYFTNELLL